MPTCNNCTYLWSNGATTSTISVDPNATTTYTVTVERTNTCTSSSSHTLTVLSRPNVTISGDNDICIGESTALTTSGCAGCTYLWSHGATGATVSVDPNTTTTYTVTATDPNGCDASADMAVTVRDNPAVEITGSSSVCSGESATLSVTECTGCSYSWSTGEDTPAITITPNATTTYEVSVTRDNCTTTESHTVEYIPKPGPVIDIIEICDTEGAYEWDVNNEEYSESTTVNIINDGCTPDQILQLTVTESTTYCKDADGDNYGSEISIQSCDGPPNDTWVTVCGDCDDSDDTVYPDAPELPDCIDNDCDGAVDNLPSEIRIIEQPALCPSTSEAVVIFEVDTEEELFFDFGNGYITTTPMQVLPNGTHTLRVRNAAGCEETYPITIDVTCTDTIALPCELDVTILQRVFDGTLEQIRAASTVVVQDNVISSGSVTITAGERISIREPFSLSDQAHFSASIEECEVTPCAEDVECDDGDDCTEGDRYVWDEQQLTCLCAGWYNTEDKIENTSEICSDGIDNDCDGLVDCADEDCLRTEYCVEEIVCGLLNNRDYTPDDEFNRLYQSLNDQISYDNNSIELNGIQYNIDTISSLLESIEDITTTVTSAHPGFDSESDDVPTYIPGFVSQPLQWQQRDAVRTILLSNSTVSTSYNFKSNTNLKSNGINECDEDIIYKDNCGLTPIITTCRTGELGDRAHLLNIDFGEDPEQYYIVNVYSSLSVSDRVARDIIWASSGSLFLPAEGNYLVQVIFRKGGELCRFETTAATKTVSDLEIDVPAGTCVTYDQIVGLLTCQVSDEACEPLIRSRDYNISDDPNCVFTPGTPGSVEIITTYDGEVIVLTDVDINVTGGPNPECTDPSTMPTIDYVNHVNIPCGDDFESIEIGATGENLAIEVNGVAVSSDDLSQVPPGDYQVSVVNTATMCRADHGQSIIIKELCENTLDQCTDGEDNDDDGLTDCQEIDCIPHLKTLKLLKANNDSTLSQFNVIQDSIVTWGDCIDIIDAGIIDTSTVSLDSIECIRYEPMSSTCGSRTEDCSSILFCPDNDCGDYFVSLIGPNDRVLTSEVVHVTKKEVTLELLNCVFSETDSVRLLEIIEIFNKYHDQFEINTPIRIAHFLAQVGHETNMFTEIEIESSCFTRGNSYGWSIWANNRWDNSLIRGCSDVTEATEVEDFRNAIFRVPLDSIPCEYVCNCHEDEVSNLQAQMNLFNYGRRCMQGHGDENSGDGWNYRGRGLVQLTWKSNYIEFNEWLAENTNLNVDVVNNPDLVGSNMEIAILSALWYWESRDVNQSADMNDIDMITQLINGSNTHIDAREEIFDSTLTCINIIE